MDREILRAMARSERMMDSGEIPFVWAPSSAGIMERLACTKDIMKEFGLETGQRVNSILREAIISYNLEQLAIRLEEIADNVGIEDDFDFRKLMDDEDDNNS